ncbi:MAG: hypothetical protein IT548_05910 [Alphaproteobacteria bacterium]|nr:hypothetical protein [Alphaproteobacteria bacterium]
MSSPDDGSTDPTGGRDLVLRRGTAATALLRRAARVAHEDSLPISALPPILRPKGGVEAGDGGWFSVFIRISFLLVFVIPTVLVVGYFGFVASGQYESEIRFAVKNGEMSTLEQSGVLGVVNPTTSITLAQDTLVITNYVKSRPFVEQLQKELDIRAMFSRDDIDFLSAFGTDGSIEDLVRYWSGRLKVSIDSMSGLVTIDVRAFTPEDALKLAQALMQHSEEVANQLSARTTADLVKDTEQELKRAEERLKEARATMQDLRNAKGTLDPDATATGLNELIAQLRLSKIETEAQLATYASLSPSAPQVRKVRARIAALNDQIAKLEAEITDSSGGGDTALSQTVSDFDRVELENQVAERRYAGAVTALEAARLSAERRKVYITPFVDPQLAEDPTSPPRLLYVMAGLLGPFLLWAALIGIATFVRRRVL